MGKDKLKAPKFVPDPSQTSPRVYSNFVSVRSTGLDFTLSFADVLPPTKKDIEKVNKGEEVPVPLQTEIVVPNTLIPSLINALSQQYEKYQQRLKEENRKRDAEGTKSKRKS